MYTTSARSLFVLATLVLLAGVATAIAACVWGHQRSTILAKGESAQAVVWGRHRSGRGGRWGDGDYLIDLRYRLNERTQRASAIATEKLYRTVQDDTKVPIRYLPSDPENVVIVGDGNPFGACWMVAGGALIGSIILAFMAWRMRLNE